MTAGPAAPAGSSTLSPAAYAAYEAYVMTAPDELNFREPDKLDGWEYPAWEAAAQAAIEAGPNAPERLAKGNTKLREENGRLRERLQAVKQLAEQALASGIIDSSALLAQLDPQ